MGNLLSPSAVGTWLLAAALVGFLPAGVLTWRRHRRSLRIPALPPDAAAAIPASSHRRVRLALLLVLAAGGIHALLQGWQDRHAAAARAFDVELLDVAGGQRWHSQRVARLALDRITLTAQGAGALRSALDDAMASARKLEERLETLDTARTPGPLREAVEGWRSTRGQLWERAEVLLANAGAARDDLAALARRVEGASDPALQAAQRLVQTLAADALERNDAAARQTRVWYWLSLAVLGGFAVIVVEPAVRIVKRQHGQLAHQARDLSRLALVAQRTSNMVVIADRERRIVWVNDAFATLTGYGPHEAIGRTPDELLSLGRPSVHVVEALQAASSLGEGMRAQVLAHRRDGRELWLDLDTQPVRSPSGELAGFVDVAVDVTERRRQQAELQVAAVAFNTLDAVVVTDAQQRILKVNEAFTRITGYSAEEAHGQLSATLLYAGQNDPFFYSAVWDALNRKRHWQGEAWNRRKSGEVYSQWLTITGVLGEAGEVTNFVAVFADITQKKQADDLIHSLAFYDPLTELPNRRLLRERLQHTLASCARHRRCAAVMFIDLDHFKTINDTRGHDVGDQLLVQVAKRLRSCVRAQDTVARQGGDEFVIVLEDLGPSDERASVQAHAIAEKIRESLNRPFALGMHEHHCTPSIGISTLCGNALSADELLKRADTAMYQAKHSGRNAVRFFDPTSHAALEARVALEADLRKALPARQFTLHFQSQVDLSGAITDAEVLLRWSHPLRGDIPPAQFIPVAEDSELIVHIDRWVLETACAQLSTWARAADPCLRQLQLAVNVSARHFRDPGFVDYVQNILAKTAADPSRLELELTETLVLGNVAQAAATMRALRQFGVRFAMDDFGTGQSSLAYLSRLPLDQLKIDQSFVRNIGVTPNDDVIVQTIIGMARTLGLDVIAEGVETEAQRAFLQRSGCYSFQGWLFGQPLPLAGFESAMQA